MGAEDQSNSAGDAGVTAGAGATAGEEALLATDVEMPDAGTPAEAAERPASSSDTRYPARLDVDPPIC